MSPRCREIFENTVDLVQIGARNMQNFDLLKEVGKMSKPVLLETGPCQHLRGVAHVRRIYHG